MRDLGRLRDKVELSLDGRQIFFLFFGSAVLACLVFVAGVLVGKRVEARALALSPPPPSDPLAALDQLGDVEDEALTYHRKLTQRSPKRVAEAAPSKETPRDARVAPAESEPPTAAMPMKRPDAVKKGDAASGHYTLQLSAFPEKRDAEEFIRKVQTAGYHAFLVSSEIPGKGTFYRVRMGDYASRQAAVDAKNEFERKQRGIAYVTKL